MWRLPYTQPVIAEALASFDNEQTDASIMDFQTYMIQMNVWFSLGWRGGIEYGLQNEYWGEFYDLHADDDDDELVPTPVSDKVKRPDLSPSLSLHRIIEAPSPKEDTALSSASAAQLVKETKKARRCEKVLSRLFEVGRLMTRKKNEANGSPTRFIVAKALGPPDCAGLWILALPPWEEDRYGGEPETPPEHEDEHEDRMSDNAIAEMRKERVTLLDGFPEPISYARIKENGEGEEFDLKDSTASSFVLSMKYWRTE